jgi:hypothetical protein
MRTSIELRNHSQSERLTTSMSSARPMSNVRAPTVTTTDWPAGTWPELTKCAKKCFWRVRISWSKERSGAKKSHDSRGARARWRGELGELPRPQQIVELSLVCPEDLLGSSRPGLLGLDLFLVHARERFLRHPTVPLRETLQEGQADVRDSTRFQW